MQVRQFDVVKSQLSHGLPMAILLIFYIFGLLYVASCRIQNFSLGAHGTFSMYIQAISSCYTSRTCLSLFVLFRSVFYLLSNF